MLVPKRVLIVRHGESKGNKDRSIYTHTPDWTIKLTKEGRKQARDCGQQLGTLLTLQGPKATAAYYSPWVRAEQTTNIILEQLETFPAVIIDHLEEDPRLQEQNYGGRLADVETHNFEKVESDRSTYGKFWYRLNNGENFSDVYNRIANFWVEKRLDWMMNPHTVPHTLIIVCHGATSRVLLGYLKGLSTESISNLRNPHNCEILDLKYDKDFQKYI